ncbi:MAG: hypothetical protein LBD85_02815 [Oscillospiraceae bacterium]|jgi:hypothetical protein|nr:hypothetical protein [Oscillospiraceae bacterium]
MSDDGLKIIFPDSALEARAKLKHFRFDAKISDADRLEPFIIDGLDEQHVTCPDTAAGQANCNATQQGYVICPTGMPYPAPTCPAPKQYSTTAYAGTAEEEATEDIG